MNLLQYFNFSIQKKFCQELAKKLAIDIPPAMMENRRKLLSVNKITRLLERTYQSAITFQVEQRMGFIKRSIFINNFKWELKNLGYPDDFIDVATEGLIVEFSKINFSQEK
ncbi:MAG: hypothetical protein PHF58_12795 [Methylotenera sp.]|nr:hypothetical protein [Methylotenera sp.]